MSIQQRKKDHVDLTVNQDVSYRKSTGFDRYDFIHDALPETNPSEVDITGTLFKRDFSFPLFISSMTGGYTEAGSVNTMIAKCCQKHDLPFGVGSQRAMLEDAGQIASFSIVREHAPDAFIAANIGGAQIVGGLKSSQLDLLINSIQADAIIVHLNPLQELMQPEGDHNFKGIEKGIEDLVASTNLPVIVKETGAGISRSVAKRVLEIGVKGIDVAGAGGTSWAKVENLRERQINPQHQFDDWGIPTVDCILAVKELKKDFEFDLIGSGGVRTSFDLAKCIALGTDLAAAAQPVIKTIVEEGESGFDRLIDNWKNDVRKILTLLGCHSLNELSINHLTETGR